MSAQYGKSLTQSQRNWRARNPTLQLRAPRELHAQMRAAAAAEGLAMSAWLRRIAIRELRRKAA
jgi:predicted HicB family RNase H-like nuclease